MYKLCNIIYKKYINIFLNFFNFQKIYFEFKCMALISNYNYILQNIKILFQRSMIVLTFFKLNTYLLMHNNFFNFDDMTFFFKN